MNYDAKTLLLIRSFHAQLLSLEARIEALRKDGIEKGNNEKEFNKEIKYLQKKLNKVAMVTQGVFKGQEADEIINLSKDVSVCAYLFSMMPRINRLNFLEKMTIKAEELSKHKINK